MGIMGSRLREIIEHHQKSGIAAWNELLDNRAPYHMDQRVISESVLCEHFAHGLPVSIVSAALDVRDSTGLMEGAISLERFADNVSGFFTGASKAVRDRFGFVGTFTGDGMLAYWIVEKMKLGDVNKSVMAFCTWALRSFKPLVIDGIQENLVDDLGNPGDFPRPLPTKAVNSGLSVGVDCGEAILTPVMTEPTILGAPVVRAFRACGEAKSGEIAIVSGTDLALSAESAAENTGLILIDESRKPTSEKALSSGIEDLAILGLEDTPRG